MNKYISLLSIRSAAFFSAAVLMGLLFAQPVSASFQSSGEFDQHGQFEQNIRTANPPGQTQRQPNPYRRDQYNGEQTQRQYYEEVTPTNIEQNRNYLLQSHPLQEAPLPQNRI